MLMVVLYSIAATWLALYGLHVLLLVIQAWRHRGDVPLTLALPDSPEDWPTVTVQLPLYNEPTVVERVIDAAADLEWPHARLQIQVLDDSTDRTTRSGKASRRAHWRMA